MTLIIVVISACAKDHFFVEMFALGVHQKGLNFTQFIIFPVYSMWCKTYVSPLHTTKNNT